MKIFIFSVLFFSIMGSSVMAGFYEGVAAYEAGNVLLAFKEFHKAGEEGHADSQFNLSLTSEGVVAAEALSVEMAKIKIC